MPLQHLPTIALTVDSRRLNLSSRLSHIRFDRALLCSTALAGFLAVLPPVTPTQAQNITTDGEVLTPTAAVPAGAQPHPWNVSELLVVGNVGTGSLDIEGGGVVNGSGSIVGNTLTGRGTVTVSGLDSVWNTGTAGFSLIVGNAGGGELNIVSRGKVNADGLVIVGNVEGSAGTMVVDSGGEFNSTDLLVIGEEGTGSLAIRNGTVSSFRGAIGRGSTSGGAVTVTGPSSTWAISDVLSVGGSGSSVLYIENGGSVSNTHSAIGGTPGAVGIVTVSGLGSTWTNSGSVDVGYEGSGTLRIEDGGVVSNLSARLGTAAGASGTVTVVGANSQWTNTGYLSVGDEGTGALNITSGGSVSSIDGYVGFSAGSNGTVTVDGPGSEWRTFAALRVGMAGTGSLAVTDSGNVTSFGGSIGDQVGSTGVVTVDGSGSQWSTSGIGFTVGNAGTGTLNIANGGAVVNGAGHVGLLGGADGTVNVDGAGSTWTSSDIHVGVGGTGRLNITNGAGVSGVSGYIADDAGSDGTVVVDGSGSTWTNAGNIHVGDGGQGRLDIRDGGWVRNGFAYIGNQLGSAGTVNVDGLGSVWQMSAGNLYVGNDGVGALTITNGGSVSNIDGFVGAAGIGSVIVDGAQSAWTNRALYVGVGGIGSLTISNGGRVDNQAAEIGVDLGATGSALVDGAGSLWFTSGLLSVGGRGDGVLTVANDGQVHAGNIISLGTNGGHGRINIGGDPVTSSAVAPGTLDTAAVSFDSPTSALTFNHTSTNYIFAPELQGDGLVHHFAGTTILTGNSGSFTGATDVIGGTLRVDGTLGGTGSTVMVASGGTLGGGGTVGGDVTVASGGVLAGAAGSTLTMNNLVLDAGANINVSLGAPFTTELFNVATNLTLDGTLNVTDQPGFGPGLYRVFDYGGALIDNGLEVGTTPIGYSAGNLTVQTAIAGEVNLLVSNPVIPLTFWNGSVTAGDGTIHGGTGTWDATTTNWTDATGTGSGPYNPAGLLIFAGAPGTVTVDGGAVLIQVQTGMQFAVDGYSVAGDDIGLVGATVIRVGDGTAAGAGFTATIASNLTGAGSLQKTDLGTLVLAGANSYAGGTEISGGTLRVSADGALGDASGGVTLDGGTLAFDAAMSSARDFTVGGSGGALLLDGGTVNLSGLLSGSGNLAKRGTGLLHYTGDGSGFTGDFALLQGGMRFDGTLAGSVITSAGTTLWGSGQVGNLRVGGRLEPGASIGTLTVTGDLTLESGSTYVVELNDAGNVAGVNNDLVVAGTGTIQSGATIHVAAENGTDTGMTYTPGTVYTVIQTGAAGSLTVNAAPGITDSFAFLSFTGDTDGQNYYLTSHQAASFCLQGATFNQCSTANAVQDLGAGHLAFDSVLFLSEPEVNAAFDAMSGEVHASGQHVIDQTFALFNRTLRYQGTAGVGAGNVGANVAVAPSGDYADARVRGAWAAPLGAYGSIDSDGNAARLEWWNAGLAGGYEGAIDVGSGNAVGGFGFGYIRSHGSIPDRRSTFDGDGFYLGAYGAWNDGPWTVAGALSYGGTRVSTERGIVFGAISETATADYWTHTVGLSGEAAYAFRLTDSTKLAPLFTLDAGWSGHGGFTERGAGAFNLTSGSESWTRFDTGLGLALTHTVLTGHGKLTLEGRAVWEHAFADVVPDTMNSFVGGAPFEIRGPAAERDRLRIGAGLAWDVSEDMTVRARYDGLFSGDQANHTGFVGLNVRF